MGQDDSQVSGQSRAAGMIRAGSTLEVRGGGFDPRQAEWSGRSQAEFSQLADSLSGD